MSQNDKKKPYDLLSAIAALSQLGLTIAACVVIGILLGRFLDNRLGSSPWLLIIFSILGALAAFRSIFEFAKGK